MRHLLRAIVVCSLGLTGVTAVAQVAAAGDAMLARQLTDRGIELQQRGDHNAALRLFDAALIEANHPKIRYLRAKSLRALDRFDEAIAEFESILERSEVAKYRTEIAAFINDMRGELERARLNKQLE
jgi:tetratricopeptide (TPR) repeat protein